MGLPSAVPRGTWASRGRRLPPCLLTSLLPGWWRRQWRSLCPTPKLPSASTRGGWGLPRHHSRSPQQTGTRLHRGEGPADAGPEAGAGPGTAHRGLSPGPAASSPSPWSGSWRAAGTSAQLSASWRSQDPVLSHTYRAGALPGLATACPAPCPIHIPWGGLSAGCPIPRSRHQAPPGLCHGWWSSCWRGTASLSCCWV